MVLLQLRHLLFSRTVEMPLFQGKLCKISHVDCELLSHGFSEQVP